MRLATCGDNCVDYYKNTGNKYVGGNPVNVAVYFRRLGEESSYIGVVGNDEYGDWVIGELEKKEVNISNVLKINGKTAVSEVELVDGERVFGDYDEGVLESFVLTNKQKDFILEHDILHTGLWGKIEGELEYFKKKGIKIAFDAATRPFDEPSLVAVKSSDYFFFASDSTNLDNLKEDMKKLWTMGAKQVIATLGSRGSIVFDGVRFREFGIVKCEVVDTMGAGDSFISAYLKGSMDGLCIEDCMELGATAAAETISYKGAW